MGKVIAIDGPSGAGKGTVAKLLAGKLGFTYLDTGALYRAIALLFLEKGMRPEDSDERLSNALKDAIIAFDNGKIRLNGRDVSADIRSTEAGHFASVFSARKVVRDFLLGLQRDMSSDYDLVAEGRDTTTVVFPSAWKKFYVDASVDERIRRRYLQLKGMSADVTEADARKDIVERDKRDSGRDIAPLAKAKDAVPMDTTNMSVDQVVEKMLEFIRANP